MINITQTIETDLLIVGAGIAGLSAAIEAKSQSINPLLISKSTIGSGASYFPLKATLGIQVTGGLSDHTHFREDIEHIGKGKINPHVVQAYIEESPTSIELLNRIGFKPWRRNDNRPACFAKYPRPIYLINDWRESAIRAKKILVEQKIPYYENATLLHIVTENNQVQGAVFSLNTSGQITYIFCKTNHIILAAGGIAGLYKDNLYPADVIGSLHAIAHQAGATLVNLAFIQFIPAFVEPKYKVLFGEHTLKYVTKVTDSQGNNLFPYLSHQQFTDMMQERSCYAPFSLDFNCVEFDLVMMKHLLENPNEQGVYLTYSPALYEDEEAFYQIYLNWLKNEIGIDLIKDTIAIKPFAHSCNGGIQINEWGESAVKGLFAIGEIAHCIEGANRLGGNSVGGGLVFAKRAIAHIKYSLLMAKPQNTKASFLTLAEKTLNQLANPHADLTLSASEVLSTIREKMALYANVYRTVENLKRLLDELKQLERRFNPIYHAHFQGIEIYYALKTAQLIVINMLNEKSLGAHYLDDKN